MDIGIAAPIEVNSLKQHLSDLTEKDLDLGLGGSAVNILIDGFIKQGHSVTIFTLDPSINGKYILKGPNLKIIIGHFRIKSKLKWFDFCYKEFVQIQNFIVEERDNVDIVNAHWSYEFAIGTILADVPHVITFRDYSPSILKLTGYHPYRFFRLLMDFWVRRNGENFSFNSKYLKDKIQSINGMVIPNPIHENILRCYREFPTKKEKIKICFVANGWSYIKNPETAIAGFMKARREIQNITLHLIGKEYHSSSQKVKNYAKQNHLESVNFVGKLNHQDLLNKLNDYDIMLHTSREESFGNNLVEAMATGIPVIGGADSGAVPWVLDNGNAGILVDVENVDEVCDAIKKLCTEPIFFETLSKEGFKHAKENYSQESVCNEYLSLYKSILSE